MFNFRSHNRDKPANPGRGSFTVSTRIARATGQNSRYSCGAVRVLPSVDPEEVVLEATDGKQAVCLLTPGRMAQSRLVPPDVLPTRRLTKPAVVRLDHGHWQSSEGRIAEDAGEGAFPPIADVLPAVGKRPLYETPAQAERRSSKGRDEPLNVVLGLDVHLLRKAAEALGTTELTLFVPMPVMQQNTKPQEAFVTQPVAVCPANGDGGTRGLAVLMPLKPANGHAYYKRLRETIVASEQRATNTHDRSNGHRG